MKCYYCKTNEGIINTNYEYHNKDGHFDIITCRDCFNKHFYIDDDVIIEKKESK